MKSKGKQIWAASALLLATSTFAAPSSKAGTAPNSGSESEIKPVAEPYEPGSSAVVNDWHFSPGEPTLIGANVHSHHQRTGHCRSNHHHHFSS